ncbi:suprabasin isoform 3 precursor [Rattus norvegicus]|uniref:suprabasin isoform 3 precursor n=1 Tax=Rattus norvegicus TaxID=10116 RepID=UPI0001E72B26|nr:suprabasin isoform 3 precursor [Rattus norvegicus]|eukprot:NP_001185520.1 suprabasin isoform 3 precursor [Rattus norvegicus]
MHLVNLLSSCCLLALLGALPARAAHEDPIEKAIEGFSRGLSNAEKEGPHQGQSGYGGQHGGAAITTAVSGASVNKPFINFPALWRSIAAIMP